MSLLGKLRMGRRTGPRAAFDDDRAHLRAWAESHEGVEAFVEPRTTVTAMTMLLVDRHGEWTRRRIPSADGARKLGHSLKMPVYDVQLVGYPQRMRDHDARQRILRDRRRRDDLNG